MSNVWVIFEYMDRLPLVSLSILLKEIQIIHQNQVVTNFKNAIIKEQLAGTLEADSLEFEEFKTRERQVNIGIFASFTYNNRLKDKKLYEDLHKQFQMAFRVISLQKPRHYQIFKAFLFTEKFTLPDETA